MALAAFSLSAPARADVELDPATDTVRVAGKLDGTLTGPAPGAAAPIGLRWVREHRADLGLTLSDLETLGEPAVQTFDGIRQVRWPQQVDGIEVADAELRVNVAADGRLINVLGSPSADLPADTTPLLAKPAPSAELTIFGDRLAYRYTDTVAGDAIYDTITDADTGKVLKRSNLVKGVDAQVWDNHPSTVVAPTVFDLSVWGTDGAKLENAWMHVYKDTDDDGTPQGDDEVIPGTYPFVPFTEAANGCTAAKPCSWNAGDRTTNLNQNAVQAYYLANRFREHLAAAPINFNGFEGADKLRIETSDGGGDSNANMYTPRDGEPPLMQMYLWGGRHRYVNSGDDASILFHEYTHGLTSRLVVDASGAVALNSPQSGAMGEGWSDFYAKDFLVADEQETDTDTIGEIRMGVYMDRDSDPNATRAQAMDCPVGAAGTSASVCPGRGPTDRGGFTYGDFGKIFSRPEVHYDGEIWAQTLWDLRRKAEIGPDTTRQLVTRALVLSPPEPTFLDMRNAILQADAELALGKRAAIWEVFAARGMGYYAGSTSADDIAPVEDFRLPPAVPGDQVVSGRVTDDVRGTPAAGVRVSLGGLTAGPDALVGVTGADGRFTISGVPAGTFANVVLQGGGFERKVVQNVAVPSGELNVTLRRDWAALAGGAKVTTSTGTQDYATIGCGAAAALDGLATTTWSAVKSSSPRMIVELPGAVDMTKVGIDPGEGCLDSTDAFMRRYEVHTGPTATGPWTLAASGTFGFDQRHKLNEVAATVAGVRYVRLTPLTSSLSLVDVSQFSVYGTPADSVLPTTRFIYTPPALVTEREVAFAFSGNGTGFQCSLDGAAFATCRSGQAWTVADGPHAFAVRSVNGLGPDPSPETYAFTVDATPPDTIISWGPPPILTTRDFAVAFTATEDATFTCVVDGGEETPCTSPLQLAGLSEGAHSVVVTATDTAGHVDLTPARSDFTVIIPGLPPAPSPTPTATPTPTVVPRGAIASVTAVKSASLKTLRKTGKLKVSVGTVKGAKVSTQTKLGTRVVGTSTRTAGAARLTLQLTLSKARLRAAKPGGALVVRVQGTGPGLKPVTRTVTIRLRA